ALMARQPEPAAVATAHDWIEALVRAGPPEPEPVVVDLPMPRLDGVSTVARLRHDYPAMCLIALTGAPSPELQSAAREAGADTVLHKSEMLDGLLDRLAMGRAHADAR